VDRNDARCGLVEDVKINDIFYREQPQAMRRYSALAWDNIRATPAEGLSLTNMGDIMEQTVAGATSTGTHGTGRDAAARLPRGTVVAGKTGTSSDTRDSWFAGFTGSYVSVAWVGYDDNRETGLTGAAGALPVWADTLARLRSASFEPVPPELVEDRWIGFGDGLETSPACSADAVLVSVPKDTALPAKPGCGPAPTGTSPSGTMGDKIKEWLKHIVH